MLANVSIVSKLSNKFDDDHYVDTNIFIIFIATIMLYVLI